MKVTEYKMHVIHAAEPSNIALLETHLDGVYKDYMENLIRLLTAKYRSYPSIGVEYFTHLEKAKEGAPQHLSLWYQIGDKTRFKVCINFELSINGRFKISWEQTDEDSGRTILNKIKEILGSVDHGEDHIVMTPTITRFEIVPGFLLPGGITPPKVEECLVLTFKEDDSFEINNKHLTRALVELVGDALVEDGQLTISVLKDGKIVSKTIDIVR